MTLLVNPPTLAGAAATLTERVAAMLPGHQVSATAGAKGTFKNMVTVSFDGVPYSLPLWGSSSQEELSRVERAMAKRQMTIDRHHALVKAVYLHLASKGLGEVWAMCGGGAQLQIFFGTEHGYLGILYLTLEDLSEQEELSESGYLAACGNETFTLVRESRAPGGTRAFEGLDYPGLTVRGFHD